MSNEKERTNHFEVSDGDTLIIACRACTLDIEDIESDVLVHEGVPLCVNGNVKCSSFYKMWHNSNGDNNTWIECSLLTMPDKKNGLQRPESIDVTPVKERCPKCNTMLVPSLTEGYTWRCLECDEDFIEVEA